MYVTNITFQVGKQTIAAGSGVTAKDLGLKPDECQRYVGLGLLAPKAKAVKPVQEAGKK